MRAKPELLLCVCFAPTYVHIDAQLACKVNVEGVLCIHKHGLTARLLHLCHCMEGQCGFAAALWAIHLHDTATCPAPTQSHIQGEAA